MRENILLAAPLADDAAFTRVTEQAWVHEFMTQLPEGADTLTGEGASRLSVGQAQRVAVARALLRPCDLLLLDEPAASLDAQSEQRVMHALQAAASRQSTLMVTHQIDTLQSWDAIWVMSDGMIVECGDFGSLSQAEGPFSRLLQHRQESI